MKRGPLRALAASLPRRDIVAICAYLNRNNGSKAVDACVSDPAVHLEQLTAAARMQ